MPLLGDLRDLGQLTAHEARCLRSAPAWRAGATGGGGGPRAVRIMGFQRLPSAHVVGVRRIRRQMGGSDRDATRCRGGPVRRAQVQRSTQCSIPGVLPGWGGSPGGFAPREARFRQQTVMRGDRHLCV
jgi:hypothetical protein